MMGDYSFDQLPYFHHEPPSQYPAIDPQAFLHDGTLSNADALFAMDQGFDLLQTPYHEISQTQVNNRPGGIQLLPSIDETPTNPRKRKAPTLRVEDWAPYKARVIELHIEQNKPLTEVKAELEKLGFTAG